MPTIVRSRVKDFAQETNKILSEMPYEKRRSIRKLIETLRPNEPIEEYLISDPGAFTWEKPSFGSRIDVWACGGGSGGGSGRKGAPGTNRTAGNVAATPAPRFLGSFSVSSFPSSISGTIGLGGDGGAPQTTNSTNGNSGTLGTDTTVNFGGGYEVSAPAGNVVGGGGGGGAISAADTRNLSAKNEGSPFRFVSQTGSGGGINNANEIVPPNQAARSFYLPEVQPGGHGIAQAPQGAFSDPGAAPRSGLSSITGNAQKGGDGVLGLGGAGGGAATDDVGNSGAGGRGGDGFVYIAIYA